MMRNRPAPLSGITVLEIGVYMAAPFATMQLADLGARIIKIENPHGGEHTRAAGPLIDGESSPFVRLNRNKESLAIDLKTVKGKSVFLKLAATADVVIENLRPGAMRKLGLGYEDLSPTNPRLIYASGSGWGQDGPMSHLPGLDIMAQARSGMMSVTGYADMPPAKVGLPVCDLTAALYLSLAITAAITERHNSGLGQFIDVSLVEAGVSYAIWEAGAFFAEGIVGRPRGSAHQSLAPYQVIRTSDGFLTVGASTQKTWIDFCHALELDELLQEERYADANSRLENLRPLIIAIEERTVSLTTNDVMDVLNSMSVPCAPLSDFGEVFTDENLIARDFYWDADHPKLGTVRQIGSPMRFSKTPTVRASAGPMLGSSNQKILTELGYSTKDIKEMSALIEPPISSSSSKRNVGNS